MNAFIEGPAWMGCWTEVAADALENLGCKTSIFYRNRKTLRGRIASRINGLARRALCEPWPDEARRLLLRAMAGRRWEILLSIQGHIDLPTIDTIRDRNPGIRILYWIGDPIDVSNHPVRALHDAVDLVLMFSQTNMEELRRCGGRNVTYFPFGVSRRYHTGFTVSPAERRRFTCDVSFVGTYNPERGRILRLLNERLKNPVCVWGRGWRHCPGVRGRGRLDLADALKVYACSRISLNHHMHKGGLNIRFFEIPAAGGFQICDRQDALRSTSVADEIVSYDSDEELVDRVQHYLANDAERIEQAQRIRGTMLQHDLYEHRFGRVLMTGDHLPAAAPVVTAAARSS